MVRFGKKTIAVLYFLLTSVILVGQMCQNFVNQGGKKTFGASNFVLLITGLFVVAVLAAAAYLLNRYCRNGLDKFIQRKVVLVLAGLLFAVQLYIAKHIYFVTGWDVEVLLNAARGILNGQQVPGWYYDTYPNNLFITVLFALIFRINAIIHVCNTDAMAIVIVQCFLSAVVSYLVYSVTIEITKNKAVSFFAFCVYVLWVGLSPWFVIPYSDSMGILFPILMFRFYQLSKRPCKGWLKLLLWVMIGTLFFVGYKIKPQAAIVMIAIVIAEGVKIFIALFRSRKEALRIGFCLAVCFATFVCGNLAFSAFVGAHPVLASSEEKAFGMTHFMMMGLCEETDGRYSYDDVVFSESFATKAERTEGNLQVARDRLKSMGVKGLGRHLLRKTLVNFGDGTFAWTAEGHFFKGIAPEANDTSAPFLRSIYYSDGAHYLMFTTVMQCVWLTVFVAGVISAIGALTKRTGMSGDLAVLQLSLIGLTAFITLFEARARYLYTYAPFYVVCAAVGLVMVIGMIRKEKK